MRKILKKVLVLMLVCTLSVGLTTSFAMASENVDNGSSTYAYRDSLPIQYEIWYSYKLGTEYRNYVYRDYTFLNGYNRRDVYGGTIELTPLQLEFYSKAELWRVEYSFY